MKGGCLCGSVKYEIKGVLQDIYYCHCNDCQILSGSAYHVLGLVDTGNIATLGTTLTCYTRKTRSGYEMTREFCAQCGTPLFLRSTRFDDVEMVTVSSLYDKNALTPSFQIWVSCKSPWSDIDEEVRSFSAGALDG